jgi:hypothetical protein
MMERRFGFVALIAADHAQAMALHGAHSILLSHNGNHHAERHSPRPAHPGNPYHGGC